MNSTPAPSLKTRKSEAIAQCLIMASRHFGTTPKDVLTGSMCKRGPIRETRQLLAYHLHECGMSYKAIGKLWGASEEWTYRAARHAALFLVSPNYRLIHEMPAIETSLAISKVDSCARCQASNP